MKLLKIKLLREIFSRFFCNHLPLHKQKISRLTLFTRLFLVQFKKHEKDCVALIFQEEMADLIWKSIFVNCILFPNTDHWQISNYHNNKATCLFLRVNEFTKFYWIWHRATNLVHLKMIDFNIYDWWPARPTR